MFLQQRQQKIIDILLQDNKWYTLEELANQVPCAVKTVREDLHSLKYKLPSDWKIELVKGKGVKLHKPSHAAQANIHSLFKQENIPFRVLDQLLQGQIHTIAQLADALYMRVATLSSHLHRVQDYLQYFDLNLHKRPLRIEGVEAHIIYMFYESYFNTYGWNEWPFPEEIDVFSYIQQMERKLDIQFYPSYTQRLSYLLAIAIQRKKQGHEMKILPVHEVLMVDMPFYHKINELPPTLCNVPLTKSDRIFITIAVNCCMFIHSNQNQYKKELLQHFSEGTSTVYQHTHKLVTQLEKEFDIPFRQDEEFLFNVLQYLRQILYRHQFIPTLTAPTSEWQTQIKQKHDTTFQKVRSVYTKWVQEHPFLYKVQEDEILTITLQIEAIVQLSKSYCKKVLLYVEDYILWKRYIQSVLYHEFGNTLFIIPEEIVDIHKCDLKQLHIDGIISMLPLEKIELPILQISVVPTRRELDAIQAFLHRR
ncbi:BglG family transcription antiterminator [Bacillus cereus]|uniref:BglG family transcription antiterminator n=1 Tax=Bacillus cereus TaxID=1396 RepID=UPI0018F47A5B|nr:helix-turn-helix domain-containing protein [Bacillus cereus]MBJ8025813.1 helix-turn-helix domain-containing protein [Bacillus cereus]MBJ8038121.1 helix-turn-helix domain-containing protein [Bacillus cereus]